MLPTHALVGLAIAAPLLTLAPEDILHTVLVGIPLVAVLERPFQWVCIGALSVGVTYGLLRRRLAVLAPVVFGRVPEVVAPYVPERYRK